MTFTEVLNTLFLGALALLGGFGAWVVSRLLGVSHSTESISRMYCPNPDCPHVDGTGEPAEYLAGITTCQDCGTSLVETRPNWPEEEQFPPEEEQFPYEEFVPVKEVLRAALVPFVESLLRSADIRFFIKGERVQDLFGAGRFGFGFNIITGPPLVYVEPAKADEAKELLKDVGPGDDTDV